MHTNIQIEFADGEYDFAITNDGALAIELACKAEIGIVRGRLLSGVYLNAETRERIYNAMEAHYGVQDIWEPLRQGLRGGAGGIVDGKPTGKLMDGQVNFLMRTYASVMPWDARWKIAALIMETCAAGVPVIEKKKDETPSPRSPRPRRPRKTGTQSV